MNGTVAPSSSSAMADSACSGWALISSAMRRAIFAATCLVCCIASNRQNPGESGRGAIVAMCIAARYPLTSAPGSFGEIEHREAVLVAPGLIGEPLRLRVGTRNHRAAGAQELHCADHDDQRGHFLLARDAPPVGVAGRFVN